MAEILLSNHALSSTAFKDQCGIDIGKISSLACISPVGMIPNTPYLNVDTKPANDNVLTQLSFLPPKNDLANLTLSFGSENIVAIAEATSKLSDYGSALAGASTSLYVNRVTNFTAAANKYQSALMSYRKNLKLSSALKLSGQQKVHSAFNEMQNQFKHELNLYLQQNKVHKNTPLMDVNKATNIAKSSRNVVKLNIVNQSQASHLVKFTKQAKFLGNGLALLDFGGRVGNIRNSYKTGGHWEREMFIESTSFAASAGAGILAIEVGSAALGFIMVATPIGWVGLIVGGVSVAGVAAYSSIKVNSIFRNDGGGIYDEIMRKMNLL